MLEDKYKKKLKKEYEKFSKRLTRFLIKRDLIGEEMWFSFDNYTYIFPYRHFRFLRVPRCWQQNKNLPDSGFWKSKLGQFLLKYSEENNLEVDGQYKCIRYADDDVICVLIKLKLSLKHEVKVSEEKKVVTVIGLPSNKFLDF